jgi:hypothetical protein
MAYVRGETSSRENRKVSATQIALEWVGVRFFHPLRSETAPIIEDNATIDQKVFSCARCKKGMGKIAYDALTKGTHNALKA